MTRPRTALLLGLLLLGVLVSYERVLSGPPVFDDGHLFSDPARRPANLSLPALLDAATDVRAEPKRILTNLTFALNFGLFGEGTYSFHLVNLVLHGLAVLAACALFREVLLLAGRRAEIARRVSLLAAALFALSPVQTAAVSCTWQRSTVLAGLFLLTALWLFAGGLRRGGRLRIALAILLVPPAVLAKQNGIMLVPAMLGLAALFGPPGLRRPRGIALAVLLLAVTAVVASLFWWGSPWPGSALAQGYEHRAFTLGERLLTQPRVVLSLLGTVLLPVPARLNLDHDVALSTGLLAPPVTLLALAGLAALLLGGLLMARRRPVLSLGLLWFPVLLLPESTVVPLEMAFDHRAYLPSAGVYLLLGLALHSLATKHPRAGGAVIVLLLTSFGTLTMLRNEVWTSRLVLWRDAAAKSPAKARPHFNLALALRDAGEREGALSELRRALVLDPGNVDYAAALNALVLETGEPAELLDAAELHRRADRFVFAEELLLAAGRRSPRDPEVAYRLARVYADSGGFDAALEALEAAVRLGFADRDRLAGEPVFRRLQSNARFLALLEKID